MKRSPILILILLLGGCALRTPPASAQVFQKAITDQHSGLQTSSDLFNQGQAQSLIAIDVRGNPGTCNPAGTTIGMQGSFDGIVWQDFGETYSVEPSFATTVSNLFLRRGEGYFPRVRIKSQVGADADCEINIWYSGTQQTVSPKYEPDPFAGGLQWYCQTGVTTAATEFTIVPQPTNFDALIVVHALFVYSDTVRIFDIGYNLAGPTWVPLMGTLTLPDDGHLVLPAGVTPYFTVPQNAIDGLKLKLFANATPVTACALARYSAIGTAF